MPALMWFRSDVRTRDNTALTRATHESRTGVIGLYVICPGQWRDHDDAPVKIDFIRRTLAELTRELEKLNIPLKIRLAQERRAIPSLIGAAAEEWDCDSIYFNREYEVHERQRDEAVEAWCAGAGRACHPYDDQTLAAPGSIRTGTGNWYTVYTPFRRALYAHLQAEGPVAERAMPRRQAERARGLTCDEVPTGVEGFGVDGFGVEGFESGVPPELWPAGEAHARRRLSVFASKAITHYKERRDLPALDGTSALSPYLAIGAISARQCVAAALAAARESTPRALDPGDVTQPGIAQWISEVAWREFFIHVMAGFPRVCMHRAFQRETEAIRWNRNEEHLRRWMEGRTGVPIVDAGMRQLAQTGWMHNRVRMITAMYLSKNLFLDWRLGERHFMRHLVDGFLACNNGGWQWSASTGTDAAPYFRIFNPVSQSKKFDPDGVYIKRYVPELAVLEGDVIHEPWTAPALFGRAGYPEPLVDLSTSRQAAIAAFRALKEA